MRVPSLAPLLSHCPSTELGRMNPGDGFCQWAEQHHPSESRLPSHMDRGQHHLQPGGKTLLLHLTAWNPAFVLTYEESGKACGDGLTGGDRLTAWEHDQRLLDEPGSPLPGLAQLQLRVLLLLAQEEIRQWHREGKIGELGQIPVTLQDQRERITEK